MYEEKQIAKKTMSPHKFRAQKGASKSISDERNRHSIDRLSFYIRTQTFVVFHFIKCVCVCAYICIYDFGIPCNAHSNDDDALKMMTIIIKIDRRR